MKKKRFRFLRSNSYLSGLLELGDNFYVGLNYADYAASPSIEKYKLPNNYTDGREFVIPPLGPTTKVNIKGKFERKQPEEKETRRGHVSYTRKTDGVYIAYDRDFHSYKKVQKHRFEMQFHFGENEHNEQLVLSPLLVYDGTDETEIRNTHAINMFLELFGEFEVYMEDMNPAIGFNQNLDFEILPKGTFDEEDIDNIVTGFARKAKEDQVRALQKRLRIIREYNPELRGKGTAGFFGYVVFGFPEKGYVVLESMYLGRATYVFPFNDYERIIALDKQTILRGKLYSRRFYHYEKWEERIRRFLAG